MIIGKNINYCEFIRTTIIKIMKLIHDSIVYLGNNGICKAKLVGTHRRELRQLLGTLGMHLWRV